ncbi:MAG: carotenoid biosynthesis protein [Rhodothermaceae bacterium]|nr:carotenoid biosynthesis protein [Bacteroidota bacterium]MXW14668.1 carotenoid biosynthesis protein [Rhodothermaceae bacterium]MXW33994.1 carotenoid biosynthesis protein [Rhodothermaceae bacterium]MYC04056.1 carotenoid biosynthesis protein [Rhodothermaceae bacterium]MYE61833.1 carotenoid biosynthesis protein [Rhodothermaceae bacterium]
MTKPAPTFTLVDWLGLSLLWLFTVTALTGYGSFGLHPRLLARFPESANFYPTAFLVFSRGHVIFALLVLAGLLTPRIGFKWLPALMVTYAISLGMELMGTYTGFPFGGYEYTGLLGYRIANLVPLLIPFSWFMMAFPAYVLARRMASGKIMVWVLGAVLLTIWDLTLDPAMSDLTPYWRWDQLGPYYGMPLVNLLGWLGTGFLIMIGFHALNVGKLADRIPTPIMEIYYITVIVLSLGMTILAGYWLAVILTLAAFAGIRIMLYQSNTRSGLTKSP